MVMNTIYRNRIVEAVWSVACVLLGLFCSHSSCAGPNELRDTERTNATHIGIELMSLGSWPTVVRVHHGSSAEKAGLKVGDRLCSIADRRGTLNTKTQDVSDVMTWLCGPEDTTVTLTVTERTWFPFAEPKLLRVRRQAIMINGKVSILDPYEPFKEYFIQHAMDGVLYQVPAFAIINGRLGSPMDPLLSYTPNSIDLSVLVPAGKGGRLLELRVRKAVQSGDMSMMMHFCGKGDGDLLNYGAPWICMEVPMEYFGTIATNGIADDIKAKFIDAAEKDKWSPLPRIGMGSAVVALPSEPVMLQYESATVGRKQRE